MISQAQYDFLVDRTKKRETDLQDAIREALIRKALEDKNTEEDIS